MPSVRVVTPTYNRAALLDQALQSVAAQSFRDLEVVVADDGSTDATNDVLSRWERRDPRFHSVRTNHRGVAAARNAALAHAGSYEYVAFLDSDDLWRHDHLERSVDVLDSYPEAAVTFAAFETQDESGTWTEEMLRAREERVRKPPAIAVAHPRPDVYLLDADRVRHGFLRGEFSPHPSASVVRASAVAVSPWFRDGLEILEDCLFFIQIACANHGFAYLDGVHTYVRHHGDNLTGTSTDLRSATTLRRQLAVLNYVRLIERYCRTADDRRVVRARIADQAYLVGQCYAEQLDLTNARRYYFNSLRRPSARALKGLAAALLPQRVHDMLRPRHRSG
jgi:glycosyltransferase involved in cell wall biosynthesis